MASECVVSDWESKFTSSYFIRSLHRYHTYLKAHKLSFLEIHFNCINYEKVPWYLVVCSTYSLNWSVGIVSPVLSRNCSSYTCFFPTNVISVTLYVSAKLINKCSYQTTNSPLVISTYTERKIANILTVWLASNDLHSSFFV